MIRAPMGAVDNLIVALWREFHQTEWSQTRGRHSDTLDMAGELP
jgi:hypothetical protein